MEQRALLLATMEILLVDDSAVDCLLAMEALSDSGFGGNTHTVNDGGEAVSFLKREGKHANSPRPQLVLLDLNLPGKSGHEVLQQMKNDVSLKDIPVVVFSSSESEEDITRAYAQRANCYVRKPGDFRGYREVVQSIESFWSGVARLPQARPKMSDRMPDPVALDAAPKTYNHRGPMVRVLLVEDNPSDVLILASEAAASDRTQSARVLPKKGPRP